MNNNKVLSKYFRKTLRIQSKLQSKFISDDKSNSYSQIFKTKISLAKNPSLSTNIFASLDFLLDLQSIWLEERHVLVNPSHMLVHVRAVLRLVLAVDASEVAFLAMIAAESLMHRRVLRRETMKNGWTRAMGKAGPAISVGHGSTWKNCYKIRRIKQAFSFKLTALS